MVAMVAAMAAMMVVVVGCVFVRAACALVVRVAVPLRNVRRVRSLCASCVRFLRRVLASVCTVFCAFPSALSLSASFERVLCALSLRAFFVRFLCALYLCASFVRMIVYAPNLPEHPSLCVTY